MKTLGFYPPLATHIYQRFISKKKEINGLEKVIYCFYYTLKNPMSSNNTNDTYIIWCKRNNESNKIKNMEANKFANQRRYIIRNKKLTEIALEQIKEQVINATQKGNNNDNNNKYGNKNRNNSKENNNNNNNDDDHDDNSNKNKNKGNKKK